MIISASRRTDIPSYYTSFINQTPAFFVMVEIFIIVWYKLFDKLKFVGMTNEHILYK